MFYQLGFAHGAQNVALRNLVAFYCDGNEMPLFIPVKIVYRYAPRYPCAVLEIKRCKRTLNTVEYT